mmetsp:Transcript_17058/g.47924  ORF Transcript_17058/g.47924 Transcript_17058/m.47924 type:complete len:227 (-) Transcript_17058:201-881(-)
MKHLHAFRQLFIRQRLAVTVFRKDCLHRSRYELIGIVEDVIDKHGIALPRIFGEFFRSDVAIREFGSEIIRWTCVFITIPEMPMTPFGSQRFFLRFFRQWDLRHGHDGCELGIRTEAFGCSRFWQCAALRRCRCYCCCCCGHWSRGRHRCCGHRCRARIRLCCRSNTVVRVRRSVTDRRLCDCRAAAAFAIIGRMRCQPHHQQERQGGHHHHLANKRSGLGHRCQA